MSSIPIKTAPHLSPTHHTILKSILPPLLAAISQIGHTLHLSHQVSSAGSANSFGDEQLNVDVLAENILRKFIAECPLIVSASSEEDPVERAVEHASRTGHDGSKAAADGEEKFTVAFDPLDGSSIIGPNWTVGTIVGIWKGTSALGQSPREKQVASVLGVYGPRTTAIIAIHDPPDQPASCYEVGLDHTNSQEVTLIRPNIRLSSPPYKTKYFAPANLRAAADSPPYMSIVSSFILQKYTLRYSGGLVPDIVHALVKGHGLYTSPVTAASKAKLRRLYELCPIALIVESAGGKAVDPLDGRHILDKVIENCDERAGLVCGNGDDVEVAMKVLLG